MQQTHFVQAAIPVAPVLVVVAHVHLADVEAMARQEPLRKEGVGQERRAGRRRQTLARVRQRLGSGSRPRTKA